MAKLSKVERSITLMSENEPNCKLFTIIDRGNGLVKLQSYTWDDKTKKNPEGGWAIVDKEALLGALTELWPDEIAIVKDDILGD